MQENGAEFVLIKAPSLYPYWYEEYDAQIEEYAAKHNLRFYNFTECIDEIGLDFSQDTYDGGLHLNLDGAIKFADYFADILAERYDLTDYRNDPTVNEKYVELLVQYDSEAIKQKGE